MTPFFTIITATYNAAPVLPRLLDSLAGQTCRDFELLIQDGASTDETVAIAESYRDRLPVLSMESAPDDGIYDAWNKALPRRRGEWIFFLGADDELAGVDVLAAAKERLMHLSQEVTFAGAMLHCIDAAEHITEILFLDPAGAMRKLRRGRMPTPHPALLHKSALFDAEQFDPALKIAGDYDFLCRTWPEAKKTVKLDLLLVRMHSGGISSNLFSVLLMRKEVLAIMRKYFPEEVSLVEHVVPVAKGYILQAACLLLGKKRAPEILDRLRMLRGLPPVWTWRMRDK